MNIATPGGIAFSQVPMSFFAAALDRTLPEHGMSQADLARKTDIAPSLISRYLAGTRPEAEAVEKIAAALGHDGPQIVVAWVRDAIPESYRSLIHVEALKTRGGSARVREDEASPWDLLDKQERAVFEKLRERCHQNPKMMPLLRQILATTA